MGQRYGMLPSQILETGSTFDMVVMDISLTVEGYQKNKNQEGFIPPVTTEELERIRNKAL